MVYTTRSDRSWYVHVHVHVSYTCACACACTLLLPMMSCCGSCCSYACACACSYRSAHGTDDAGECRSCDTVQEFGSGRCMLAVHERHIAWQLHMHVTCAFISSYHHTRVGSISLLFDALMHPISRRVCHRITHVTIGSERLHQFHAIASDQSDGSG